MKKYIILLLILALCLPVLAEVKFKDLPADHWASKYVYDLVKLGITTGYPDGTFRGKKNITRYETAIFLSKLAQKLGAEDLAAVKSDLNAIKTEIATLKKNSSGALIRGSFEMNSRLANILANAGRVTGNGPVVNYRLISALSREYSEGTSLKVGLDTMDNGYYGGNHDLTREMLDFEGKVRINPVDLGVIGDVMPAPLDVTVTAGPGILQHTDTTGFLSSETGVCYIRPYTGFWVTTNLWGADITGGYKVAGFNASNSGKVDTNYFYATVGYDVPAKLPVINTLKLLGEGSTYIKNANSGGPKDLKAKLVLSSKINPKMAASGFWAGSKRESSGWMVGGDLNVSDFISKGGTLILSASKIGAEFIPNDLIVEELGETGYDIFKRSLLNGTVNVNAEFSHFLAEKVRFKGKGAARLSGDYGYGADKPLSRLTGQLGLGFDLATDAVLDAFYRVEQDPTKSETTDFAALGFNYKF